MNIGKSVIIKGELSGSEDLTIEGQVEGKIELRQNMLTIGPNAKIKAQVFAKAIVVQGEVHGNVSATERDRHSRQRLGRRGPVRAARGDRRRRALPRQHRHAAGQGQGGKPGDDEAADGQGRRPDTPPAAAHAGAAPSTGHR